MDRIGDIATVKSVYGEPITAHGRTLIPVARIGCGFGGGSGKKQHFEHGEGEGGGGGLGAFPTGVFEISESGTRFIPVHDHRRMAAVGFLCFCLGVLLKSPRGKH